MAASGNANSSTSHAESAAITTATSGAAAISTRYTSAWEGSSARRLRGSGARECSARAVPASRKFTAKKAAPANSTLGRSAPEMTGGRAVAERNPMTARASPAAAMLRVVTAAWNAHRCGALRWAAATATEHVTRSSKATGSPQYNSAAKPKATEATGGFRPDRSGVMIGRIWPTTIRAAMIQNRGCRTRPPRPDTCVMAQAKTARPATVTEVMWIHGGDPGRGLLSLVSFGSFIGLPHRCNRLRRGSPWLWRNVRQNRTSRSQLLTKRYDRSGRSRIATIQLVNRLATIHLL